MTKVGNVIILEGDEALWKGDCTADVVNKASLIIHVSQDDISGADVIRILKMRNKQNFKSVNKIFLS